MKRGKPEKFTAIADAMRLRFDAGRCRQGDPLPPERTLAEQFGCSHLTIRKALKRLEENGVLYRLPSRGTFFGQPPPEPRKKNGTIGFLFPDDELYYYKLFSAMEEGLFQMNLHPVMHITGGSAGKEAALLKYLAASGAEAVISVPNTECTCDYASLSIPAVFLDVRIPGLPIPCVRSDDRAGALAAMEYLKQTGHRRIAFIGSRSDDTFRRRLDVFRQQTPECSPSLIQLGSPTREWGYYAAKNLFSGKPPDAVFCGNDTIAAGVVRHCMELGIRIPADCQVVGFGNTAIAEDLNLTSVSQHSDKLASELLAVLQTLLKGETPPEETLLPASLVIRGGINERLPKKTLISSNF